MTYKTFETRGPGLRSDTIRKQYRTGKIDFDNASKKLSTWYDMTGEQIDEFLGPCSGDPGPKLLTDLVNRRK
jgi:hypothetical protein